MFVVKVPGVNNLDETCGCKKSGDLILDSLKEISSNEKGKFVDLGLLDLEEIHVDNSDLESKNLLIYKNALEIFEEKSKTIFLGGDHSITFFLVKAFIENCRVLGKEPCLIVFDSNPNCIELNETFPKNVNWLRYLVEEGFSTENIFLAGIRNFSSSELVFLRKNKIKFLGMNSFLENLEDSCDILMEFAKDKEMYISIDISSIDPAFAPGNSFRAQGGFTSREFIYLIQRINLLKNIRGIDIVEINSELDLEGLTVKLGAKILSELL